MSCGDENDTEYDEDIDEEEEEEGEEKGRSTALIPHPTALHPLWPRFASQRAVELSSPAQVAEMAAIAAARLSATPTQLRPPGWPGSLGPQFKSPSAASTPAGAFLGAGVSGGSESLAAI